MKGGKWGWIRRSHLILSLSLNIWIWLLNIEGSFHPITWHSFTALLIIRETFHIQHPIWSFQCWEADQEGIISSFYTSSKAVQWFAKVAGSVSGRAGVSSWVLFLGPALNNVPSNQRYLFWGISWVHHPSRVRCKPKISCNTREFHSGEVFFCVFSFGIVS